MKTVRLAKFLADAGLCSRRGGEELIRAGRVKIAGQVVTNVATAVDPSSSDISLDDNIVGAEAKVYYLLNKPAGYVSSVKDPHNPRTVVSLVPAKPKVWPVGRLDKESTGLLLLTNDGDLTYELTHPKFKVKKTYQVVVDRDLAKDIVAQLKQGIQLTEGLAQADEVTIKAKRKLELVIHQGWKRQIRRMLSNCGYEVEALTRIREGQLSLVGISVGRYRQLKLKDIK